MPAPPLGRAPSRTVCVPVIISRRDLWLLDSDIAYLNHGSYGACPRPVLEVQAGLRARMEAEPARFLTRELGPLLDTATTAAAAFLGANPADLVFVPNATTAVNAVLRSLKLLPGDELIVTDHSYPACRNAVRFVAERAGAAVVTVPVPFPAPTDTALADLMLDALTPRTRLVLLDHVTSPTALVFPVEALVSEIEGRGVPVLVDAAHAPGMVPMALDRVGASYTAGNFHKWVCAPKGSGFLHVRADRQREIRPTVISHGASATRADKTRFKLEFGWTGTVDPTPYLSVPVALELMASLDPGGWPWLMRANREAAEAAAQRLAAVVPQPLAPVVHGAMASLILPGRAEAAAELQDQLLFEHQIEVPVIPWAGQRLLRVSMQRYVCWDDIERLAVALRRALGA